MIVNKAVTNDVFSRDELHIIFNALKQQHKER
jgi:hypothetical protein